MDERNENDKLDEILLPGFRFHPTDEELVGFYLKRKIQQRPLSIELIKQLDIYKYDPWDLPKLATTGEKEWYFYCPRDRKYRNSARPNRVTGAGFWKATGTDRPIYSSEGNKCIGLKKSLVFYKGKAAKGIKTDWMMHEFRLPSLTDSVPPKRFMDKTIPANDSWAICRIFKKANSTAQRALSQSCVSPLPETASRTDAHVKSSYFTQFSSTSSMEQYFNCNNDIQQQPSSSSSCLTNTSTNSTFSPFDFVPYKPINPAIISKPHHQIPNISSGDLTSSFMFSPFEPTIPAAKCNINDVSSVLLSMSSDSILGDFGKASGQCIDFVGSQDQYSGFSTTALPHYEMQAAVADISNGDHHLHHEDVLMKNQNVMNHVDDQWESTVRPIGFPFSLPTMSMGAETWKPSSLWDCSSCPREISTSVSTSKCML